MGTSSVAGQAQREQSRQPVTGSRGVGGGIGAKSDPRGMDVKDPGEADMNTTQESPEKALKHVPPPGDKVLGSEQVENNSFRAWLRKDLLATPQKQKVPTTTLTEPGSGRNSQSRTTPVKIKNSWWLLVPEWRSPSRASRLTASDRGPHAPPPEATQAWSEDGNADHAASENPELTKMKKQRDAMLLRGRRLIHLGVPSVRSANNVSGNNARRPVPAPRPQPQGPLPNMNPVRPDHDLPLQPHETLLSLRLPSERDLDTIAEKSEQAENAPSPQGTKPALSRGRSKGHRDLREIVRAASEASSSERRALQPRRYAESPELSPSRAGTQDFALEHPSRAEVAPPHIYQEPSSGLQGYSTVPTQFAVNNTFVPYSVPELSNVSSAENPFAVPAAPTVAFERHGSTYYLPVPPPALVITGEHLQPLPVQSGNPQIVEDPSQRLLEAYRLVYEDQLQYGPGAELPQQPFYGYQAMAAEPTQIWQHPISPSSGHFIAPIPQIGPFTGGVAHRSLQAATPYGAPYATGQRLVPDYQSHPRRELAVPPRTLRHPTISSIPPRTRAEAEVSTATTVGSKQEEAQAQVVTRTESRPTRAGLPDREPSPEYFAQLREFVVYILKPGNEADVRASIEHGIWSSSRVGNERLHKSFEDRTDGAKVLLLFSISGSRKVCGLAEMVGPWDQEAKTDIWVSDRAKGHFAVSWLVCKDVAFSVFSHMLDPSNHMQPITVTRDACRIHADLAREVVVTYVRQPKISSIVGRAAPTLRKAVTRPATARPENRHPVALTTANAQHPASRPMIFNPENTDRTGSPTTELRKTLQTMPNVRVTADQRAPQLRRSNGRSISEVTTRPAEYDGEEKNGYGKI